MAVVSLTKDEFRDKLSQLLNDNPNMCWDIVSYAIGKDGTFADDYDFFDADEFFSVFLGSGNSRDLAEHAREMITGFHDGTDLDDDSDGANPYADYLKWNSNGDIDSTDYPAEYIRDNGLEDIVDYVMENIDNVDSYPEEVQDLIYDYLDNSAEEEE